MIVIWVDEVVTGFETVYSCADGLFGVVFGGGSDVAEEMVVVGDEGGREGGLGGGEMFHWDYGSGGVTHFGGFDVWLSGDEVG